MREVAGSIPAAALSVLQHAISSDRIERNERKWLIINKMEDKVLPIETDLSGDLCVCGCVSMYVCLYVL